MKYKREININKILYQVGDTVNLPFNETGIINSINNNLWGFTHSVKITKGSVFHDENEIVEFKPEQFT